MFGLIKKNAYQITNSCKVSTSNHSTGVLLSNQKCITQHTLMKLHPNEYSQELHYYPIVVKLIDRCTRSCNVLNEASNKVCVPK